MSIQRFPRQPISLLILGLVLQAVFSGCGPATHGNIVEGVAMATAMPNGQWKEYVNAHNAHLVAANKDACWFVAGRYFWRYDCRARRIDAFTSSLNLPHRAACRYTALADDGRFAWSGDGFTFLWTPGGGWSQLPQPCGEMNPSFLTFDARGRLCAGPFKRFTVWEEGQWQPTAPSPAAEFFPVEGGWFNPRFLTWFDYDFKDRHPLSKDWSMQAGPVFHIGGKTLVVFSKYQREGRGPLVHTLSVRRIHKDSIEQIADGGTIVLDLCTGEAVTAKPGNGDKLLEIPATGKSPAATIPAPRGFNAFGGLLLLRDRNGHYWTGIRRYDGSAWRSIMPEQAFDFGGDMRQGIADGRLKYNAKRDTWFDAWPDIPSDVGGYDPQAHTGWVRHSRNLGNDPFVWTLEHFKADGSQDTLQTVTIRSPWFIVEFPPCRDGRGNWWFGTRWRWDGKALHEYDDGSVPPGKDPHGTPMLVVSRKGILWRYNANREWERYDSNADAFKNELPYDDFSFEFAGKTFAAVGNPIFEGMDGITDVAVLYVKPPGGSWQRMADPALGLNIRRYFDNGVVTPLRTVPRSGTRGDRLLLTCYGGDFEWDASRNLWAYLAPHEPAGSAWTYFDSNGRRLLVSSYHILAYEGEPIGMPWRLPGDVQAEVENLLRRMDSDLWSIRDAASKQAINLIRKYPQVVRAYLSRKQAEPALSVEVRLRVQALLLQGPSPNTLNNLSPQEKDLAWTNHVGNSLLDRMTQPVEPTFPGGYVVNVGMNYELAQSILNAAGAKYSSQVNNQFYGRPPDDKPIATIGNTPVYPAPSRKGFLLPDNTMIYMWTEKKGERICIRTLGMGPYGKGYDGAWPWDAPTRNNLPQISLRP